MKTYTRPSRGTLRAHHLVKLSLILTVSICVLIGRWQSPINKASETQIGSLSTAAERMAFLRGAALPVGQLKGAQNFRDLKEGVFAVGNADTFPVSYTHLTLPPILLV